MQRRNGWQLMAGQETLDLLLACPGVGGLQRAVGEAMRNDAPVWSRITLRRPTKPQQTGR